MVIEIRNTGFINKGAELMLRSIVSKIRERLPEAIIAMWPDGAHSYEERARMGLYHKLWLQRYRVQWSHLASTIPKAVRRAHGLVLDSEVDVVLDASGFAYSSDLGDRSTREAARLARRWKEQGTKLILLPQALGPFSKRTARKAFLELMDNCELVFARDKESYDHAVGTVGIRENLRLAPDFTTLLQGELPSGLDDLKGRHCIIPNSEMIARTPESTRRQYLDVLAESARYLLERGRRPFILLHEVRRDVELAKSVSEMIDGGIDIVHEENALKVKAIIGASEGVVSSRFHGIVSGLSQCVPTIGTGWSHKYRMLFRDYGFPEGLLDLPSSPESLRAKLNLLMCAEERGRIVKTLSISAERQKSASREMWDQVFGVMNHHRVANGPRHDSLVSRDE